MFTGIIEAAGVVRQVIHDRTNIDLWISAPFTGELKPDQSIAHNGVCLTVTEIDGAMYRVTLIAETLERSNLGKLKAGDEVNLERCLVSGGRLDGHIVQGHVDTTGLCREVEDMNGSWKFTFSFEQKDGMVTVPKGSICVNGVSLTVVDSRPGTFSVAIIPYTFNHTNFGNIRPGDTVNLEFDVIGKYVAALVRPYQ